jgi:acyl dehydratase
MSHATAPLTNGVTEQDGSLVIEQRGLWFEEFSTDAIYRHRPGRTVTEADNVLFTTLTMNSQTLHLDEHWSGRSGPGLPTACSRCLRWSGSRWHS